MSRRSSWKSEQQLDDLNVEFRLPDLDLYSVKSRYFYHQLIPTDLQTLAFEGLVKYDHDKAIREVYHYPRGWFPSETAFARSTRATQEDHGYCVTLATNISDYRSEAWIFDAQDITAGPITRIAIPGRIPVGFHASWSYGRDLWPAAADRRVSHAA